MTPSDRARPLSEAEDRQWQSSGATARAAGLAEWDCSLLKAERMPAATGESISDWQAKANAWIIGYRMQAAMETA